MLHAIHGFGDDEQSADRALQLQFNGADAFNDSAKQGG